MITPACVRRYWVNNDERNGRVTAGVMMEADN